MYGMTGNDVMFGEGQDDDMVGGWGNDWMSGGTGDDGVVGSDGRIYTSRNGLTEPLNGLTTANVVNQQITTPGNMQQATIYVANLLNKSVDLSPFNYDPNTGGQNELFIPLYDDDILFGGLGNDFLHGGAGDDAISGAEALPAFYAQPGNPGNVLAFNPAVEEFRDYDEFDPLRRIDGYFLNFATGEGPDVVLAGFTTVHTDGNDEIFGDLG